MADVVRWPDGLMACQCLGQMCNAEVRCALAAWKTVGGAVESRPTVYITSGFTNIAQVQPFNI